MRTGVVTEDEERRDRVREDRVTKEQRKVTGDEETE